LAQITSVTDEMIMDIEYGYFSGVMFTVGRLARIEKTIGNKMICK